MFEQMDITKARSQEWDVIIAGSSFSAMFFLRGLPENLRVLIVERGTFTPHAQQLNGVEQVQENYAMDNLSGHEKEWRAKRAFGGNSNCWWGQVPRFHPSDFTLFEDHGVGAPWLLRYDDLDPFWTEVEHVMEIAGGGTDHIFPRSEAYPFPPHRLTRNGALAVSERSKTWLPVPCARSNGGSRANCCATGTCHLCPIDAKFTIENGVDHFNRDGVYVLPETEIRRVEVAGGRAVGALVKSGEKDILLKAAVVALGTNAINNAAILLRSGLVSPVLGKFLHEQSSWYVHADVDAAGYFGGTSITEHCYHFIDPENRSDIASVLMENYNAPKAIRLEPGKWTQTMRIKLIAEDIPQERNAVTLDADEPLITWHGHSAYADAGLQHAFENLADAIPFGVQDIRLFEKDPTEAHIQGTHRMGTGRSNSVVNADLETHEIKGLYALGSGCFPTSSTANPTLTLSALSLRAARSLR